MQNIGLREFATALRESIDCGDTIDGRLYEHGNLTVDAAKPVRGHPHAHTFIVILNNEQVFEVTVRERKDD